VTDEGAGGRAQFLTTTQITGQTLADLPQAALYRLICLYLIGHLNEKSLLAASEWLADAFSLAVKGIAIRKKDSRNTFHPSLWG
jgi:hypothetical protein